LADGEVAEGLGDVGFADAGRYQWLILIWCR
jgi:hypothetical protein